MWQLSLWGTEGGSLFARLSARLLFRLTSACAWYPTAAPAAKHTCETEEGAAAELGLEAQLKTWGWCSRKFSVSTRDKTSSEGL